MILVWASLFVLAELEGQGRLSSSYGRMISAASTDFKLALRGSMEPWSRIVLVEIDERALVPGAPGRWPWRSEMVAALATRAFEAGAKSVGLDPIFHGAETDPSFAQVTRAYANRFIFNRPTGAVFDPDGVPRQARLSVLENGRGRATLAVEMAQAIRGKPFDVARIPTTPIGTIQINFRGPEGAFPHLSSLELLIPGEKFSGRASPQFAGVRKSDLLKDAAVLIVHGAKSGQSPRPEWSANVLDNLLAGDVLVPGIQGAGFWMILLLLTLGAAVFARATLSMGMGTSTFALGITLVGLAMVDHQFLFSLRRNWGTGFVYLELISLWAVTVAAHGFARRRKQADLKRSLSKHVGADLARKLARSKSEGTFNFGGERREITVLVCELDGFDALVEKMNPETLVSFIREYYSLMQGVIFRSKGTLDGFTQARMAAFWGAPNDQADHAELALKAGLEALWMVRSRREHFMKEFGVDLKIRLGLASGSNVVGNLGPDESFSYRAIGEAMTLASRLVGMTREYGVEALSTQETLNAVRTSGEATAHYRVIDEIRGSKVLRLVQILEERLPAVAAGLFAEGLELWRDGKWEDAISRLERANQALGGEDGPSQVLLRRCRELRNQAA